MWIFKRIWNKINVFKKIKLLEKDLELLDDSWQRDYDALLQDHAILTNKYELLVSQVAGHVKAKLDSENERTKALADLSELMRRRDETIKRLRSPIPDEIIGSNSMAEYKFWVAQPLIDTTFTPHVPRKNSETFVDGISAVNNIAKYAKLAKEKRKEDGEGTGESTTGEIS